MITKLTLRNFKSVGEQVYDFTRFDLLVGRNNSGKSTVLQAMAIWQFCVDEVPKHIWQRKKIGTPGNCIACHTRANEGRYGEREVRIPQ